MDQNPNRYTITAALPYTNGPVHIGHLAGVYVPADIYARYQRLQNKDVVFICGSDEHGVPITIKAKKEGITPQQVVDKYHAIIKKSFEDFGISFDNYSRTSAEIHHKTASEFFKKLYEEGKFTEEITEQLYDEEANQFLADRYITGTCPKCGNEEAYGDQCEKCGSSLNATELINPKSAISGNVPILKETKHWFLPLNEYEDFLKKWILVDHKKDWKTNVYGQCKSWIDDGLRPRAVTRDLDWGIPVPVEGADGKVLYVWFDAPIGYISSTKEWAEREGKNWEDYWKDENTKMLHFIGKDNIVFHCIIFPAMLKAEGSYILPENVPANEFLNLEGNKISTSKNWAVWLHEYLEEFPNQQDAVIASSLERYRFREAQAELMNVARLGNKYLADEEPWKTIKTDEERTKTVMYVALQIASALAVLSEPFLPFTSEKLKNMLNVTLNAVEGWNDVSSKSELVKPGHKIGKAELLFSKIEDEQIEAQLEKLKQTKMDNKENKEQIASGETSQVTPQKETIQYDDFAKLDMRVGTIIKAEKMPKADKLLVLKVDTGIDVRTIVSGIAESFKPEEIIGKKVTVLANLAPRALRGFESQGMILMTENADGKLVFVNPGEEGVENGATIN